MNTVVDARIREMAQVAYEAYGANDPDRLLVQALSKLSPEEYSSMPHTPFEELDEGYQLAWCATVIEVWRFMFREIISAAVEESTAGRRRIQ